MKQIEEIAKAAGEIIRNAPRESMHIKSKEGHANYVTMYDERVQDFIETKLRHVIPDAHFVGEEEGQEVFLPCYEEGYTFIIDPIDGTLNFMKDYQCSVISIALLKDGAPYIGVVYNPYTEQLFRAQKGCGAYCNGERIRTSDSPLSRSLVSMGTAPYYDESMTRKAFEIGHWYLRRSLDIRRTGSAAYDLCLLASGKTGLFFEPILGLWDYAAGALIVEEAGGKVTDLEGAALSFRGKSSVCAVSRGVSQEDYLPHDRGRLGGA